MAPKVKTITVEAFDEHAASSRAKYRATSELGQATIVKSITLATTGRNGFLGIGRKPNQYEVEILRKAVVEVVYKIIPPNVEELMAAGNVEGLLKALNYQKDDAIRQAALTALLEMGRGQDAVKALEQMNDTMSLKLLKQTFKAADAQVRLSAIQAFGKIKDPNARKLLIKALKDADPNVRKTAIQFLARTKNTRTVKELVAALSDPDSAVSKQAAYSLGSMGASAVNPLIAALEHEDKNVRKLAVDALGRIGDKRAVKVLIGILNDADADVRKEVPMALGNIAATARLQGNSRVTFQVASALIDTLEKREPATYRETVMTLQLLSGQDFGNDVNGWRQWLKDAEMAAMLAGFPKGEDRSIESVLRW